MLTTTSLVQIDVEAFADAFARRSILVQHSLVDHPLFTMEAIAELADRLPPHSVRREHGHLPIADSHNYVDVGEGPPSASVLDVERNGFRISLRDIQQIPEYAEVVNECLDEVEPLVAAREGGMRFRSGYLFISCPASTTPMHFDAEHSFLLQLRGAKEVSVAAFENDRTTLRHELELYTDGKKCDFQAMQAVAETFHIEPGLGVYLPSYIPHWVKTEAGVSVSFSIPFYTRFSQRAEGVYRVNSWLRKARLSPRPLGEFEPLDATKAAVFRSMRTATHARRKLPV
jgi:Cupin superfamily protein